MPTVVLVNTPESPCPGTHHAATWECIQGFRPLGYDVKEANSLLDCANADVLFLSNHRIDLAFLHSLHALNPLGLYILWSFQDYADRIPFTRYILVGEHYVDPPTLPGHCAAYAILRKTGRYMPLYLRANEDPALIGTIPRDMGPYTYMGCFMGSGYKQDWVRDLPDVYYHNVAHKGLLTFEERRAIYCKSLFAFGFHSPENVANNHVTQRVFEGLTYGCIVLSDNPAAAKLTGGIVEYVANRAALIDRMAYYVWNPETVQKKREAGYEWAKQYGTNRWVAQELLK
jgi:hypothetical protein